ncbi:NADP-dependent oxidoreductase [Mycetocola reblochoni]|uniref:Quinone oxidoreductase n=2 Tax=Mycetocola reblochoni TaxID=331618 RepID=A0A1R4JGN0_9MICO|nr:NADP-dependent oxidoreductase [Mycetocola reblochoni]RLP68250.1 NADP-dependent oxidoreductase [Mycetocola reblochoni]SJN31240.1 Quinone oxidoreductase [Mycetocola reblochoni REB411]
MTRAVVFDEFGGPEVLRLADVVVPDPGPGELRIAVTRAGLNPVDAKIRRGGAVAEAFGAVLPSGNGNDFAGVVSAVGPGVTGVAPGDRVFGGRRFEAQAGEVVARTDQVLPTPDAVGDDVAGALWIAGRTALAAVAAVAPGPDGTVLVSAAAGGVGVIATQLALRTGARVIGTVGEANEDFLRALGAEPVRYGDGLADRLRLLAPDGVTAVLDNEGAATLATAVELGASHAGGADADIEQLRELVELIARGEVTVPIERVFPVDRVRDAYELLEAGHLRGKILLAF